MTVTRAPWGEHRILLQYGCLEDRAIKVKELVLRPGQKTSLQYHLNRTELLMTLNSGLRVELNDCVFNLKRFDCIRVFPGELHQLENTSDRDLVILEVQYGAETNENDIVRVRDPHSKER